MLIFEDWVEPNDVRADLGQMQREIRAISSTDEGLCQRIHHLQTKAQSMYASLQNWPTSIDTINSDRLTRLSNKTRSDLEKLWSLHLDILKESDEGFSRLYADDLKRQWTGLRDSDGYLEVVTGADHEFSFQDNKIMIPARSRILLRYSTPDNLRVEFSGGITMHTTVNTFPKNGLLIMDSTYIAFDE